MIFWCGKAKSWGVGRLTGVGMPPSDRLTATAHRTRATSGGSGLSSVFSAGLRHQRYPIFRTTRSPQFFSGLSWRLLFKPSSHSSNQHSATGACPGRSIAADAGSPGPSCDPSTAGSCTSLEGCFSATTNAAGTALIIEARTAACTAMTVHSIQNFSSLSRSTCHRKWNFFRDRLDIAKE